MKIRDCSVLILSCDKYSDLWDPFFKLLTIYWPDCVFPVYLSTESASYKCAYTDVQVIHPNKRFDIPWSRRLKESLRKITTEYIILLMDDFFLKSKVDSIKLSKCFEWMDNDLSIASFSFAPSLWKDLPAPQYPGFEERPKGAYYRVNCQAALWRRYSLLRLVRPYYNPWDFEWQTSCRADLTELRFFANKKGNDWLFDYNYGVGGGAVHQGKWVKGIDAFLDKQGIDIDYSIRGWDEVPFPSFGEEARPNPPADVSSATLRGQFSFIRKHLKDFIKGYI